jgi:transcription initiation factor TFIIH subunit 4
MDARTKNILEYLTSLSLEEVDSKGALDRLYEDGYTTITVFRSLPPIAKQILMRLIVSDGTIPCDDLDGWASSETNSKQLLKQAVDRLLNLQIFQKQDDIYIVHNKFLTNLRKSVCNEVAHEQASISKESFIPSIEFLENHAHETWQQMLHFMVSSPGANPKDEVKNFLEKTKLMTKDGKQSRITDLGFVFLFKSTQEQVWESVLNLLELKRDELKNEGCDEQKQSEFLNAALHFFFRLPFLQPGQGYPTKGKSEFDAILTKDLRALGLLYAPPNKKPDKPPNLFYVTSLAQKLSASDNLSTDIKTTGFIIVDTTFRVYAYAPSELHVAILREFVMLELRYLSSVVFISCLVYYFYLDLLSLRLPNMVMGIITKESVYNALKRLGCSLFQTFIFDVRWSKV